MKEDNKDVAGSKSRESPQELGVWRLIQWEPIGGGSVYRVVRQK